jgi:ABC-type oligopeptide transport system ATPase subunit
VLVMHGGHMLEYRTTDELFARPHHAYTQALLKAAFASG